MSFILQTPPAHLRASKNLPACGRGESWCIDQLKCCRDYKLIVRRRKEKQKEITGEDIAAENLLKIIHCCLLLSFYPQMRLYLSLFLVKTKHNKP